MIIQDLTPVSPPPTAPPRPTTQKGEKTVTHLPPFTVYAKAFEPPRTQRWRSRHGHIRLRRSMSIDHSPLSTVSWRSTF